jgi:hypothetical protein
MIKDNDENKLRVKPVEFTISNANGIQTYTYKLPEVKTLPDDPLYFAKQIRDYLWVQFSPNQVEKSEILLLLADKKMTETTTYQEENKFNLALDTSEEAINKLKYADRTISNIKNKTINVLELEKQITMAGCAYKKILQSINNNNINEAKYQQIFEDLDQWLTEKQEFWANN